jgi:hypothetical protein
MAILKGLCPITSHIAALKTLTSRLLLLISRIGHSYIKILLTMFVRTVIGAVFLASSVAVQALNPNCAPGGNFNLSIWNLQLPIGSTGDPDTITPSKLEGCSGFQDTYFYTEAGDGALVMTVPGSPASSGCVATTNSLHCRTEFREINPSSWDPNAPVNQMQVTLLVEQPDNSTYGTVIGQVFMADYSKPVGELYYSSAGVIAMGVEQTTAGGDEIMTTVGNIPVNQTFTYLITYENNVLSVSINDGTPTILSTYSLDAPASYFKAGNYNQGGTPSNVHFFAINVTHETNTTTSSSTTSTSLTTTTTSTTAPPPTSSTSISPTSTTTPTSTTASTSISTPGGCTVAHWGQCGGVTYTGCTTCASPYTCEYSNAYYSQCL